MLFRPGCTRVLKARPSLRVIFLATGSILRARAHRSHKRLGSNPGVLAGSVAERTREIGMRSALGASRGSLLGLVLREGIVLTGFGIALGLAGALAASQALATLLFGISPLDPLTYMGVIALMMTVSVIACWTPAWRAVRVDPATTLQAE